MIIILSSQTGAQKYITSSLRRSIIGDLITFAENIEDVEFNKFKLIISLDYYLFYQYKGAFNDIPSFCIDPSYETDVYDKIFTICKKTILTQVCEKWSTFNPYHPNIPKNFIPKVQLTNGNFTVLYHPVESFFLYKKCTITNTNKNIIKLIETTESFFLPEDFDSGENNKFLTSENIILKLCIFIIKKWQ